MVTKKICDKCKSEVKRFDSECSKCGGTSFSFLNDDSYETEASASYVEGGPRLAYIPLSNNSHEPEEVTLVDLVRAQNRTTHAVRAFVRFLFIQLSAATLAIFFWNIGVQLSGSFECTRNGNCGPSTFWFVVAGITWLVGLVWSSVAGWDELQKSDL